MTITIEKGKHYIGIWFCEWDDAEPLGNWMGVAWQNKDGTCEASYRFRYFHPGKQDDPFDCKDEKNWYSIKMAIVDSLPPPDTRIKEAMDIVLDMTTTRYGAAITGFHEVEGDHKKFIKVMSDLPWSHSMSGTVH